MTAEQILMYVALGCLAFTFFMAGVIWQSDKSHKQFMNFIQTSEITKWGKYE